MEIQNCKRQKVKYSSSEAFDCWNEKLKIKFRVFADQRQQQELEKYIRKIGVKKNVWKAQEWGGMYQTYKHNI